ncbi:MAG TPA: alpha/beta hydrolase [Alphaproteobacteria bacterium]|nr:alpha/beta hydrolase [Alphaproteobacteria bacterium]
MIDYRGASYSQAEFDRQFNPRLVAVNPDAVPERRAALSDAIRARRPHALGLAYGDRPRETIDVFPGDTPGGPVLVYFHGGYWRAGSARDNNFIAEPFLAAGACVALINYDLCPTVPIGTIVAQAGKAIGWIRANIGQHGGDGERLFLLGHSAGAHLAAMVLADKNAAAPLEAIQGAALVSGIYDLDPVIRAAVNHEIGLTRADVAPFSPLGHPPHTPVSLIVAVGLAESNEWVRQSRLYAGVAEAAGCPVERIDIPDADHYKPLFDILEPGDPMCEAIVARMGLA